MNQDELIPVLDAYHQELAGMLSRFKKSRSGIHIESTDHARFNEIALELRDLFNDEFVDGRNYSQPLIAYFNDSVSNLLNSPSYRGVENVKGVVAAALARARRNPLALRQIAESPAAVGLKDPDHLFLIAERFHLVARRLRERHDSRVTLGVERRI